jgi:hypothetical protein
MVIVKFYFVSSEGDRTGKGLERGIWVFYNEEDSLQRGRSKGVFR